jgi:putative ABC transport system permease protein
VIRLALGELRARPVRLLATLLAVALGVGFVVGSLVLVDSVRAAFDVRYVDGGRNAAGVVRPVGGLGTQRYARVPGRVASTVAAAPGVAAVAPVHRETVLITGPGGERLGRRDGGSRLDRAGLYLGNWIEDARLRDQTLRSGRPPVTATEAVVHRHTAEAYGLAAGDRVRLVLPAAAFEVTITGVFDYGDADPAPHAPLFTPGVLVPTRAAAARLGDPVELRVAAVPGVPAERLHRAVAQAIGDGDHEIVPAEKAARDTFELIWRMNLGPLATGMLVFSGITVLAAGLIVFTTFAVTVARRTRRYALLRLLGAGRGQVAVVVLAEASAIGLAGGAAGVLLGYGVAEGLRALFAVAGVDLVLGPGDPTVLSPGGALIGLATGVVATVFAALPAAVRAGRVPPMQALREADRPPRAAAGRRAARAGLALLAAGAVALAVAPLGGQDDGDATGRLVPLSVGALAAFAGTALLAPRCTGPVARLIGAPAAALRGLPARLAQGNAARNPGRTALTATALVLGVGLVGFTLVVTASLEATQRARIREITFTDYWVRPDGLSSFPPEATRAVAAVDGVKVVSAVRPAQVRVAGAALTPLAVQPRTLMRVMDVPVVYGDFAALAADGGTGRPLVALGERLARTLGVGVGDGLAVTFVGGGPAAGDAQARVVAIYDPERLPEGFQAEMMLSRERAAAVQPLQGDTSTFIELDDGVGVAEIRPALEAALRGYPVLLQDAAEARAAMAGRVGSVLALGLGLLLLTVVIAVLGVANTLALSVIERTRELGLLRAVGMSRAQARSMIRWEAVIVTTLGVLLGVVLGTAFAWLTARAVPREIEVLSVPVGWLAVTVVVGALAAVLAATGPARRAARVDVLRAIARG